MIQLSEVPMICAAAIAVLNVNSLRAGYLHGWRCNHCNAMCEPQTCQLFLRICTTRLKETVSISSVPPKLRLQKVPKSNNTFNNLGTSYAHMTNCTTNRGLRILSSDRETVCPQLLQLLVKAPMLLGCYWKWIVQVPAVRVCQQH